MVRKMNFTENLRVLREKNGMTQEQLAEKMEVSRQTVSKWESGGSFPEMEKMILLTELFGCTIDGLMNGDMSKNSENEAKIYEEHGSRTAKSMAAGIFFIIFGLAAHGLGEWMLPYALGDSGVFFVLFALAGVMVLVKTGINMEHFKKMHPFIEPFYTDEEKEVFHRRYTSVITAGIGMIMAAFVVMIFMQSMPAFESGRGEGFTVFIFFTLVAIGVTAISYIGMQASKMDVEKYNADNAWNNSEEAKRSGMMIGKVSGVIMTAATALYIGVSAATGGYGKYWWFLAVGAILCGVAAILLNKRQS